MDELEGWRIPCYLWVVLGSSSRVGFARLAPIFPTDLRVIEASVSERGRLMVFVARLFSRTNIKLRCLRKTVVGEYVRLLVGEHARPTASSLKQTLAGLLYALLVARFPSLA